MLDLRCLGGKKKKSPTFGKTNLLISLRVHEFAHQWYERSTAFTLNQTNITSHSEVFALRQETRLIVSRAAVLMNGKEVFEHDTLKKLRDVMVKDVTLAHIYIEKLF